MKIDADIIVREVYWKNHRDINAQHISNTIQLILKNKLFLIQHPINRVETAILLTSDSEIRSLNLKYRKINKPTNVLSFPDQVINWQDLSKYKILDDDVYLGDVAFGYQTLLKEALEQKKSFINHFTHLLIHSVLHLLGFDHQNSQEALVMENLEVELLLQLGIESPY